jgi:N-acetylneuraminate synthase
LADDYGGTIHLSLGMTTRHEEERVMRLLYCKDRLCDTVIYHSTSGYPIEPKDACLLEIQRLRATYGIDCKAVGYSGHHNGIALDLTAFAMGAQIIERHFTLDRTWKGTDHAASLEPAGLTKLVRDLGAAGQAMTFKSGVLECEEANRKKLKEAV